MLAKTLDSLDALPRGVTVFVHRKERIAGYDFDEISDEADRH